MKNNVMTVSVLIVFRLPLRNKFTNFVKLTKDNSDYSVKVSTCFDSI